MPTAILRWYLRRLVAFSTLKLVADDIVRISIPSSPLMLSSLMQTPVTWSRINSKMIRIVLWVGVAFNALVATMLMLPATLGVPVALPPIDSDFYRWMLSYFVVLFCATYAWLALAPTISRPVVALAAIGKTGSFVIALICLARSDIQLETFFISVGDLAFAMYFFLWLRRGD